MIKKFVSLVALSVVFINGTYTVHTLAAESPNESIYTSESSSFETDTSENKPKCPCKDEKKDDKKEDKKEDKDCKKGDKKQDYNIEDDIKILTKDCNKKLFSDTELKSLDEICKCVKDKKTITEEQKKFIMYLKDKVAKSKLGDDCFKKFQELLKKDKDGKLSDDEKKELKGYLKKIMD